MATNFLIYVKKKKTTLLFEKKKQKATRGNYKQQKEPK